MHSWRVIFPLLVILALLLSLPGSILAQEPEILALIEHGPYGIGWTNMTFLDDARENWELETVIWYPAPGAKVPEDRVSVPFTSSNELSDHDAVEAPCPNVTW